MISAQCDGDLPEFRFCFVRHPLRWISSVWLHEMEFGWQKSSFSERVASEDFEQFLKNLLHAYPTGACMNQIGPFLDDTIHIGRTEQLPNDLRAALDAAGEHYDTADLNVPPLNVSAIARFKEMARAPAALLEEVMATDADYAKRFGYTDIPAELIGDGSMIRPWPMLPPLSTDAFRKFEQLNALGLTHMTYDYHFSDGSKLPGDIENRREHVALLTALEKLESVGKCAVLAQSDPKLSLLLSERGATEINFVGADARIVLSDLVHELNLPVNMISYTNWITEPVHADHDCLVLTDSLLATFAPEYEILRAAQRLKPGGTLVMLMPLLDIEGDQPIKVLWPAESAKRAGFRLAFLGIGYVRTLLSLMGFTDIAVVDQFSESPNETLRPYVDAFAKAWHHDPDTLLGRAVITATLNSAAREDSQCALSVEAQGWLARFPTELHKVPLDHLPTAVRVTIATLQADLEAERVRREQAEQGMADRTQELVSTRTQLAAVAADADLSRELMTQARMEVADFAMRYEQLRARMSELRD